MMLQARREADLDRLHRGFEADRLSFEIGCEVTPHPLLTGAFEARDPVPGVWLMVGSAHEIRAEVRRAEERRERRYWMLVWLRSRGYLGGPA